jgi:signal transduction histidine kinase
VIDQSAEIWHKVVGDKIQVSLECADDLWLVIVDRSQIEQVLLNLVLNARDAMPNGGRILVKAYNHELPLTADRRLDGMSHDRDKRGRFVQVSVEDTGTGMSDKVRARIFEPFFTTKKVGEGTGLGLPMCHGIVRQAGGWIEVRTEVGRGSTFCIVLPASSNITQVPVDSRTQAAVADSP